MLKQTFTELLSGYAADADTVSTLWNELESNYTRPGRHYHTLQHLDHLLSELLAVKDKITDWNTLLFTLFYHDAIYDPLKSNNEEKSAALAKKRLDPLAPAPIVENCYRQILATKTHVPADSDTNYFTDADLAVLGQSWHEYQAYAANVRKEYAIYPDMLYKPGRRKVLQHFLAMPQIFKTTHL